MSIVNYELLPRPERRAAQKFAKQLLRRVPPAKDAPIFTSPRGALSTAFVKPENVIAALIYSDGDGNWWSDAVLRKGNDIVQMGTNGEMPMKSADEAIEGIKNVFATIKAMRESPFVQIIRDLGFDPLRVEFLRIQDKDFGCQWLPLDETQTEPRANAFATFAKAQDSQSIDALELARSIILREAPKYVTDSDLLLPNKWTDETEKSYSFLLNAAAFASANGVLDIEGADSVDVTGDFLTRSSAAAAEAA